MTPVPENDNGTKTIPITVYSYCDLCGCSNMSLGYNCSLCLACQVVWDYSRSRELHPSQVCGLRTVPPRFV